MAPERAKNLVYMHANHPSSFSKHLII